MNITLEHQTVSCPSCGMDTGISTRENHFVVGKCPWCSVKIQKGKLVAS
jgi:predicted RNA-binding Zn-ribbon protein involved in translation (DUF1610 family)